MAERATADSVGAYVDGPNYRAALDIIRTDIARAKQNQSKAGGEAGQAWTRIEKMRVNKKGAQMAASITSMEEALAHDVIRSLVNILFHAGMLPTADLVDIAERLNGGEGLEASGGGDDDAGEDEKTDTDQPDPSEKTQPEPEKTAGGRRPAAKRPTVAEAQQAARRHLRSVPDATGPATVQ